MPVTRRLFLALLIFGAGGLLWAFNLPSPGNLPKPTAEMKRFQLNAISFRDVTFLFEIAAKNPYPLNLTFDGMTLNFTVEGAKVFTAASQGGFTVPGNSEKSNTFTVTLLYESIQRLVKDYDERDWLNTVIDGNLTIPLPKLPGLPNNIAFSYSFSQKIPAFRPQVALLDFRVQPPTRERVADAITRSGRKTDPDKAFRSFQDVFEGRNSSELSIDPADIDVPLVVGFTLEIRNEARGPLAFDKLSYELWVNGQKLIIGESTNIVQEQRRELVTVTNTFSSSLLTKNVRALFAQRSGSFNIKGNALLKLPDEIRKEPVPLRFEEAGKFSL